MLNFSFHIPTKFQETIMIWQPVFRAFGQDNDCNLCQISRLMTLDIILWIIQCKYWFKALSFLNSNNIQILLNSENLKFAIRILNFLRQKIRLIEKIAINVNKLWRIINFSHLFGEILRNLRSKKKSSNWSKIGTAYLECEHTLTNFCEFLLNSQKFYLKSYGRMRNEKTFVVSDKYQLMESRKRASE